MSNQVHYARFFAQSNCLIYDDPVDVEGVAKNIADMAEQFTQYECATIRCSAYTCWRGR